MIRTSESWDGYPQRCPRVFTRDEQPGVSYTYVGNGIFRKPDGTFWEWTPERRTPPTPEQWKPIGAERVRADEMAIFYPNFVAWAEARGKDKIPSLRVNSASVRNFEVMGNGDCLVGVLHIPSAMIYLSPLVDRVDKADVPKLYEQNFAAVAGSDAIKTPSAANMKYQARQYTAAGRFVKPGEDPRERSIGEKSARRAASAADAEERWAHVAATQALLNEVLQKRNAPLVGKVPPVAPARQHDPVQVIGTAHQQLQSTISGVSLEAMGFALEKVNMETAKFTSTSGSLNPAHFGGYYLGATWQAKIMEALTHFLRVALTHSKPTADTPAFALAPDWSRGKVVVDAAKK